MKLGVMIFPTQATPTPGQIAVELEARGFESLFLPEHTHIPTSRHSPYPGGGELPAEYWSIYDPFVGLMQAAAVTKKLIIGTGICLVTEHHPVTLAKLVASLDVLSGGRFIFGVGAGWNAGEMEHHGTPFAKRWPILRERILAMKQIWTEEKAEFHGEFVDFNPLWSDPKPLQKPHPPILMGAFAKFAFPRICEYADGWFPIYGPDLESDLIVLRKMWREAGRDPAGPQVTALFVPPEAAALDRLSALGIERAVLGLGQINLDQVCKKLDQWQPLISP
ncbi:MAG: LLM class F420-dependent oxidoreductase [Pseudomonadales bacterium]|nr:LLM class F420-dependent oxidoreductase [Pseudomonadales bacterium]